MKSINIGSSVLGLPLIAHQFGNGPSHILILGGVHGDEIEGVAVAHSLLKTFMNHFTYQLQITIIPEFNIDGILLKTRSNFSGIDLNRNLPTQDWSPIITNPRYHPGLKPCSEPETQALVDFIVSIPPKFVINLHSWKPLLNVNGDCLLEAKILSRLTGYEIQNSVGYPTPGCLGTYLGLERQIPTLTYELQRDLPLNKILSIHTPSIIEVLKNIELRFNT